jgi:GT2 family glycosyltransferase
MTKNEGYSRAYNIAFNQANGKYFVLLNFDVKVDANWIKPLVAAAEKDATIGALQPKLLSMIDEGYFEYAGASGGYMDRYGYPFLRGRIFYNIEKDEGQYDDECEVFWTSGAALFIRSDAIKASGNLDEDFFLHMEEIDLCWRLHLVGYKLKIIPSSVVFHYVGAALPQGSFVKLYLNHRNNIIMILKNLEWRNLFAILLARITLDSINIIYSAFIKFDIKHAWAIIRAYLWLFINISFILNKRKIVQSQRVNRDADYWNLIYPRSLIFDYFIRGKKTFSSLKFKI